MLLRLLLLLTITLCQKQKAGLGIDLGTTFTCVYVYLPDSLTSSVELVKFDGLETIPSVVKFEEIGGVYKTIAGRKALNSAEASSDFNTVFSAYKRLMGRVSLTEDKELLDFNSKVSYKVIEEKGENDTKKLVMTCKDKNNNLLKITPVEASAQVLKMIYDELSPVYDIKSTTVTVPVYFLENQRNATIQAASLAGFTDVNLLFEPVAAAYAYQSKKQEKTDRYVKYVVYDHGGGTLDVSAFEFGDSVLEAPYTKGLRFNGGEDFTELLLRHNINLLNNKGYSVKKESKDYIRLRNLSEEMKIKLCNLQNDLIASGSTELAKIQENFTTGFGTYTIDLDTPTFNSIIEPKIQEVRDLFEKGEDSFKNYVFKKLDWKDSIEHVLCVGGSSRIPLIREMLGNYFGKDKIRTDVDADKIVAEGAAYFSAKSAGFIKKGEIMLITTVPIPIGICVNEDTFHQLIKLGATVPATGKEIFTTSYDNQPAVMIRVGQGMRPSFKDNEFLGNFELKIEQPGPRGEPQIEVTAVWEMSGDLVVTALDLKTNKENKIKVQRVDASITEEKIAQLKREAEENKERDAELMETYKERQNLEDYISNVKLRMTGPAVDFDSRSKIEQELSVIDSWLKRERSTANKIEFVSKREALQKVVEPLLEVKEAKEAPKEEL